jgi:hypothetical protein
MADHEDSQLVITAHGGTTFAVTLLRSGERLGEFLGTIEIGSLTPDNQYVQDDDEIIEAAREHFGIAAHVPAMVR